MLLEDFRYAEQHQHKLLICENKWIRRIAGVKGVECSRIKYIREKVGTTACIVGRIVKSQVKWTRSIFGFIDPENIDIDTKINFLYTLFVEIGTLEIHMTAILKMDFTVPTDQI